MSRAENQREVPIAQPRAERVWVIGLDGATFQLLDVFGERGWMPNLAQLMREGTTAVLRSTLPPITAPAWASFLTGCNPGRHGVYAFRGPLRGDWQRPVCNASAIRAPRIWQYLESFGLSSGLINVPMSYPVQPLQGYMVAGMLSPDGDTAVAYPAEVQEMLRLQGYVVDLHVGRRERQARTPEEIIRLADDIILTVQKRVRAALQLLEQRPTPFFAIVFVAPDRIQHYAWRYLERLVEQPESAQRDPACQRVLAVYQEVDRAIGELLARRDGRTAVMAMSDHGFCALNTRLHLNDWLSQNGWLKFRAGTRSARRQARQVRLWLKRLLPWRFLLWGRRALAVSQTLDWDGTATYAGDASESAIHVNLQGREPQGSVAAGEPYRRLRGAIAAALEALRNPHSGLPVMNAVYEREAAYEGPFLDLAPDIVFEAAAGYETTPEVAPKGSVFSDATAEGRGMHARDGILIAAGPGIRQSAARSRAEIADVAPTALHLLGLPVPAEMDGRVLEEITAPEWLAARPPQRELLAARIATQAPSGTASYSADEQRLVERRLDDLGYLE
jgi:predicted AlkP superfamily phosphohydrolase/phosphomutase